MTVTFVLEKDAEVAAQEVRDKVSSVLGQLPKDADPLKPEQIALFKQTHPYILGKHGSRPGE